MKTDTLAIFGVLSSLGSISASYILIRHLEKFFSSRKLSLIGLGLISALAADTPEITSAMTAIVTKQPAIGTGVIIGSNLFNFATLIGLTALISHKITFSKKTISYLAMFAILNGAFGLFVGLKLLPGFIWFILSVCSVIFYIKSISKIKISLPEGPKEEPESPLALPEGLSAKKSSLFSQIHKSAYLQICLLVGVIIALAIIAERNFSGLGHNLHLSEAIIGDLILAAITSLPNAVAAIYLARNVDGNALISEAINSNTINMIAGILLPAAIFSSQSTVTKGNTLLVVNLIAMAVIMGVFYFTQRIHKSMAVAIIACYIGFLAYIVVK